MRPSTDYANGWHDAAVAASLRATASTHTDVAFDYSFTNFFHPLVGDLVSRLNGPGGLGATLDARWQDSLSREFFQAIYRPEENQLVHVDWRPAEIDVSEHGPYAIYNWELFYHVPVTIAVHLSKQQRFAEAQRWFHYVFDPTSTDPDPVPRRYWKFLAFRREADPKRIDELLAQLSKSPGDPGYDAALRQDVLNGYQAILDHPFRPHAVARTRHVAYQYAVVMKYLDNLIAWGDFLFQQDTVEALNEATQRYVLAANLLGERPQKVPPRGRVRPRTFHELDALAHDALGNAVVELEGQFPFNVSGGSSGGGSGGSGGAGPLFGIGRTLYFCIPRNQKLLGYWDTVAERLFKIRNCMNLAGVVRPLALFDPPIDPGMLVKAAAAGLDIASVVNGLNQPAAPVRCATLLQKALELCGEVRSLGAALLAAMEKGDAEHLALVRQRHEVGMQQLAQDVRYLQWRGAQEATTSLLTSRATVLERLAHYKRLLGLQPDPAAPAALALDRRALTEENFDEAYAALVGQYQLAVATPGVAALNIAGASSPSTQSGDTGQGNLFLSSNENADLNVHGPNARTAQDVAWGLKQAAPILGLIPQFPIHIQFWGLGGEIQFGGEQLAKAAAFGADLSELLASREATAGGAAAKTASFQRRADEWLLQHNLAAHELMQIGRQLLTSLISEQVARHEYDNTVRQVADAQEVDQLLHDKFTNEELYLWMQGELSRLYYEYYRLAFDTARRAERAMKQELMRLEVDAQDFVKFNYWDGGRKGLLAGETLHLDLKRMEMAWLENNRREMELTRHVSLRQLDPAALLSLRSTGTCQLTVPEWLYDRDCPGHYLRRIRSVAVTIPSVVGPYASVHCTLSLLRSTVRVSPLLKDGQYARQGTDDDRFVDYTGAVQSIVTSGGTNDSGMFETNLRDERYLPFEGAGAESAWKLDLATTYPSFDPTTISDVILHVRYTARQGADAAKASQAVAAVFNQDLPPLALFFSLRHDFPTEWAAFVAGSDFAAVIRQDYFPYLAQHRTVTVTGMRIYAADPTLHHAVGDPAAATSALAGTRQFTLTLPADSTSPQVLTRAEGAQAYLVVQYGLA
jgi:Tc toxin complex TcA C-terminal TcB-binding domain